MAKSIQNTWRRLAQVLWVVVMLGATISIQACAFSRDDGGDIKIGRRPAMAIAQKEDPTPADCNNYYYELECLCILGDPMGVRAALRLVFSSALWGKGGGEQANELITQAYKHSDEFWSLVSELPAEKQRRVIVFLDWRWKEGCWRLTDWPDERSAFIESSPGIANMLRMNSGI